MLGFCAQNPSPKAWVCLEAGLGMLTFGLMQVPSIGFTYVRTLQSSPKNVKWLTNPKYGLSKHITPSLVTASSLLHACGLLSALLGRSSSVRGQKRLVLR